MVASDQRRPTLDTLPRRDDHLEEIGLPRVEPHKTRSEHRTNSNSLATVGSTNSRSAGTLRSSSAARRRRPAGNDVGITCSRDERAPSIRPHDVVHARSITRSSRTARSDETRARPPRAAANIASILPRTFARSASPTTPRPRRSRNKSRCEHERQREQQQTPSAARSRHMPIVPTRHVSRSANRSLVALAVSATLPRCLKRIVRRCSELQRNWNVQPNLMRKTCSPPDHRLREG